MIKKIFKIFAYITGTLLMIVLFIVFLAGSGLLNGLIVRTIENIAAKEINGRLEIGSMKGGILSGFTLRDVRLFYGEDTILKCDEISAEYYLGNILKKKIEVEKAGIRNMSVELKQDRDSAWNFAMLMKPSPPDTTATKPSDWIISLDDFAIENFNAGIAALDTTAMIPSSVVSNLNLNGIFAPDSISVKLKRFNLKTGKPEFEIVNLSGLFIMKENVASWKNLDLKLRNSNASSEGSYSLKENFFEYFKVLFDSLYFDDFRGLLPGLQIYGEPVVSVSLEGGRDRYSFNLNIDEGAQSVKMNGDISDYRKMPSYAVDISAKNLDGSSWTHDKEMKSDISGEMKIKGQGFDLKTNYMNVEGVFGHVEYNGQELQGLEFSAIKKKDGVTGYLKSAIPAGNAFVSYDLGNVFSDPSYSLTGKIGHLDLDKLPGIDSIYSDLNIGFDVKGKGIDPGKLAADLNLDVTGSSLMGISLNDFSLRAGYNKGDYSFELSDIITQYFILNATGDGNFKKDNDIRFNFTTTGMDTIFKMAGLPPVKIAGDAGGRISGRSDSLNMNIDFNLHDIFYDSVTVKKFAGNASMSLQGEKYSGAAYITSTGITFSDFTVRSAEVNSAFSENMIDADIQVVANDSLSADFSGSVAGFENPRLNIRYLGLNFNKSTWSSVNDSATINMNEDNILINNFSLKSGEQDITVNGKFAMKGEESLNLVINRLDLQSLPADKFLPYNLSGTVSVKIELQGTSENPVINGNLFAENTGIGDYMADSIRSELHYESDMAGYSAEISPVRGVPININLIIPVHISLSDSISILKDNPGFSASLLIDSLDLQQVSSLVPLKNTTITGNAHVNIEARNTLDQPDLTGDLRLRNGSYKNSSIGADYRNIQFSANIHDSILNIEGLTAETKKGNIDLSGYLSLRNLDSPEMNRLDLALKSDNFQLLESNSIELNFNSDLKLTGSIGKPEFGGKITVNRSKLNVDYLTESMSQKTDNPDLPLLTKAALDTVPESMKIKTDTSKVSAGFPGVEIYKNLTGEAVVDIPGNTWITGKDMNFEIEGTVRAVKAAEGISLFGDLNIKRGYYKIYGRSFDFSKGAITFTGGSELNPEVDFEIIYKFRDIEKELRQLRLLIKGKMLQPQITFMLDDQNIEEKDAISYIIFGRSVNQLGEGEREKMPTENLALGTAFTQLSSVVKDVLQQSAGIDVFEVSGGENWKSGNVTIGKYITNKLFLSYERSFDFDKQSKTPDTERIMLDYQILRNLILKATNQKINSGFDLIFKKTWK